VRTDEPHLKHRHLVALVQLANGAGVEVRAVMNRGGA
jgi:hypothetical protein